jgi:hypothetical protein
MIGAKSAPKNVSAAKFNTQKQSAVPAMAQSNITPGIDMMAMLFA